MMKIVVWILALLLAVLGLLFLVAAGQGNAVPRLAIGVICLVAAGALVALARLRPLQTTHIHQSQLDLSGDVSPGPLWPTICGPSVRGCVRRDSRLPVCTPTASRRAEPATARRRGVPLPSGDCTCGSQRTDAACCLWTSRTSSI
jgi:hypothetical protein